MRSSALLALLCLGCAASPADDLCARASDHVNACAGATLVSPAACDADAAADLLVTPCDAIASAAGALAADGPFDSLRALGCAAGIVRYCEAPACTLAPPPAGSCAADIDAPGCSSCAYYACREASAAQACGPHGYYLGFGHKYCERFLLTLGPRMSPAGRQFLDRARRCLMAFMEQELPTDTSCSQVSQQAFASHVACYRDNGFCGLSLRDKLLLISAVDPGDLDLATALRTGLACF